MEEEKVTVTIFTNDPSMPIGSKLDFFSVNDDYRHERS